MSSRIKFKHSYFVLKVLRKYHFIIVTIVVLLIFIADGLFLYRYFYPGLTESRLVLQLKQETLLENLNIGIFEQLLEFNEKRQKDTDTPIDWDTLRNPFTTVATSSGQ